MPETISYCPYLKRLGEEVRYSISGYCERSSICSLRVPTLGEFQRYCSTADYRECPVYRFGKETEDLRDFKVGPDKLKMS